MRVLMIAGMYHKAGIENFIMNVLRHMSLDIQFDFVFSKNSTSPYEAEIRERGGRIYYISSIGKRPQDIYRHAIELTDLIKAHPEIEIVHIHGNTAIGCLDSIICKKAGCPYVIVHAHNNGCSFFSQKLKHSICKLIIQPYVDYALGCSNSAIRWMFSKHTLKKIPSTVVRNGISLSAYDISDEQHHLPIKEVLADKFVLGNIGRMVEQKNQSFLLDILVKLDPKYVLVIIGDGELKDTLMAQARRLHLEDRVHFIGVVDNVPDYINMMDLFLMPSTYEGLGIVLIEAQAAGKSCVVSENIVEEAIVSEKVYRQSLDSGVNGWVTVIKKICEGEDELPKPIVSSISIEEYDIDCTCDSLKRIYELKQ